MILQTSDARCTAMLQAVVAELDDSKTAAEEEASDLAASLADTVAELEATKDDLQTLQEMTTTKGNPVAMPEVAIGYPLLVQVRSSAWPNLTNVSACPSSETVLLRSHCEHCVRVLVDACLA